MNCSFCESENIYGVKGPDELFICNECISSLDLEEDINVNKKCSFCDTKIGRIKGIFKKRKFNAVKINIKTEVILCNDCGKLCIDIKNERTKT